MEEPKKAWTFVKTYCNYVFTRWPIVLAVFSLTFAVTLAVVGMVAGEFEVGIENEGWHTRGTTLADRYAQLRALEDCKPVAGGNMPVEYPCISTAMGISANAGGSPITRRHLQTVSTGPDMTFCSMEHFFHEGDMQFLVKAADPFANLLTPEYLLDICTIEVAIRGIPGYESVCRTCDPIPGSGTGTTSTCRPTQSIISQLRELYDDNGTGYNLDCTTLIQGTTTAAVGNSTVLDVILAGASECLAREAGYCNGVHDYFGSDFSKNNTKTNMVSIHLPLKHGHFDERSLEWAKEAHQNGAFSSNSAISVVVYDRRDGSLKDEVIEDLLETDMVRVVLATLIILIIVFMRTRSIFLSLAGIIQVGLSFPLAFFVYKLVLGYEFFPFLNFIGFFVIMGIGCDDLFVLFDKWTAAKHDMGASTTPEEIATKVFPDAAYAMLLTSVTTAAAFLATAVIPVAPIRLFAIFMGLMVLWDYLLCMIISMPVLLIQERFIHNQKQRGASLLGVGLVFDFDLLFPKKKSTGPPGAESAKAELFSRRLFGGVYALIKLLKYPLILIFFVFMIWCAVETGDMPTPKSSMVKLLDDDNVFMQFESWNRDLLGESGSVVSVLWGLVPEDNGDHNNPEDLTTLVIDPTMDSSSVAAQQFLASVCDSLGSNPALAVKESNCFMKDLREHGAPCDPWPVSDLIQYRACLENYRARHRRGRNSIYFDVQKNLRVIKYDFYTNLNSESGYDVLKQAEEAWDSAIKALSVGAPPGVNNFFVTSYAFSWYDTNSHMKSGAYESGGIALLVSTLVILAATLNLYLTILCVLTIFSILVYTVACCISLGFTLGFLESICFSILIGLACDFVIHIAHQFSHSTGTRNEKSKIAAMDMGMPITTAALTSLCAALVLLSCHILFFQKFGTVLALTMMWSLLLTFGYFLALLDGFGPEDDQGTLKGLINWFKSPSLFRRKATLGAMYEEGDSGKIITEFAVRSDGDDDGDTTWSANPMQKIVV